MVKKYKLRIGFYLFLIVGILAMLGFSCFNIWTQIYHNEQKVQELSEKSMLLSMLEKNIYIHPMVKK